MSDKRLILVGFFGVVCLVSTSQGQTPLSPAFTYQGRLKSGGSAVSATADFEFSLWDDAGSGAPPVGGAQVGATQTLTNVNIADGLFTVTLNASGQFSSSAFNGQARWLQIAVRSPAGGGGYTTMAPRQPVTAAPYALGLRLPHANTAASGGNLLDITNTQSSGGNAIAGRATGSGGAAILGLSEGPLGAVGVSGVATHASDANFGVFAQSYSTSGTGVYGRSVADTGTNYGVYGKTFSPSGYGVYSDGRMHVEGEASMTAFKLPTGAGSGKVLTSDAMGIGSWQNPAIGNGPQLYRVLWACNQEMPFTLATSCQTRECGHCAFGVTEWFDCYGLCTVCEINAPTCGNIPVSGVAFASGELGLYAEATDPNTTGYGLFGKAQSNYGYGVYSDGRFRATGSARFDSSVSVQRNLEVWNETGVTGTGLKLPAGAGAGKVLTSDASGNGTWQHGIPIYRGLPNSDHAGQITMDPTCLMDQCETCPFGVTKFYDCNGNCTFCDINPPTCNNTLIGYLNPP